MLDLKKIHKLDLYDKIDKDEMFCKLIEEVKEVDLELMKPITSSCELAGELLDVVQVCVGIAAVNGIDLNEYVEFHNAKLLTRGHKLL